MKLEFFNRSAEDQALIIRETAARRGLPAVMVEKDFWVSWTLAVLFAHPEFGGQLVFKGGTSLSKVFGVIKRFSEDIDLSVSPAFLGIEEQYVEQAGSRTKAAARMAELEAASIERVRKRFVPELERIAGESLGERSSRLLKKAMTHKYSGAIPPTQLVDCSYPAYAGEQPNKAEYERSTNCVGGIAPLYLRGIHFSAAC